ncbi:catabolite control protein A [Clostridium polyendosporum]|uniref:Catabolite control protein A n=1 Tax=Clostridium polyendosporum TaxID=69208 RepID=A0A919RXY6_9CLOT|nr:LacI family DNA-binding transcriptional regulator [Clostridium polyendosporum]GIM28527.1 catabolite control protein A [Clostridium polyendosporum]
MKITINEIAEMAGVSKATVSRVLNQSKPVSDEIRDKVIKVIEETGFNPNSIARSLVIKKTYLIGIVIPEIANPYFSQLVRGIEDEANARDYNIVICNADNEFQKENKSLQVLKNKQVDGIVFLTSHLLEEHNLFFKTNSIPTVIIGTNSKEFNIPFVDIDNFTAAYDVVRYVVSLGHSSIGLIRGPLTYQNVSFFRLEGYKKALQDHGFPFEEHLVKSGDYKFESGYAAMEEFLKQDSKPTVIFAMNDEMAIGAMSCAIDSGLSVPEDISIIGFDDISLASMVRPMLTTVNQPVYEMGLESIKILINMIQCPDKKVENVIFPHKIIERQSMSKIKD